MNKELTIGFGGLYPKIQTQLASHRLKYKPVDVRLFQKQADAITILFFAEFITDETARKLRHKLFNKILKHIQKCNPAKKQ